MANEVAISLGGNGNECTLTGNGKTDGNIPIEKQPNSRRNIIISYDNIKPVDPAPLRSEAMSFSSGGAKSGTKLSQTKTVVCLSLLYLTCYIQKLYIYSLLVLHPSLEYHELLTLHMSTRSAGLFIIISDYAVTINSFLNPLIYLYFCPRVRHEFANVFTCPGTQKSRRKSVTFPR